jgi:hypothetical protein
MSRCAFGRNVIPLSPREVRRLLRNGGFEVLRTDFRFIFPRALRAFRRVEDFVYQVPLGPQYQILGRKLLWANRTLASASEENVPRPNDLIAQAHTGKTQLSRTIPAEEQPGSEHETQQENRYR